MQNEAMFYLISKLLLCILYEIFRALRNKQLCQRISTQLAGPSM